MYLIAGLGNPDKKYDMTRHNIGFDCVDMIASDNGSDIKKLKHKALTETIYIGSEKVILAKPQTYMNLSGESIRDIAEFYKIDPENVIIICDDISIPLGKIRIRPKGTDGGHNGLKSIIYQLQSDKFTRIRVGVGAPQHKDYDLADYVLGRFSPDEIKILTPILKSMNEIVSCVINNSCQDAMNKFNGRDFSLQQ